MGSALSANEIRHSLGRFLKSAWLSLTYRIVGRFECSLAILRDPSEIGRGLSSPASWYTQTILSKSHSFDSIAIAKPATVRGRFDSAKPIRRRIAPTAPITVNDLTTGR